MFASRRTLTLALAAITTIHASTAAAQTTAPSQAPPAAPSTGAAPAAVVTQQATNPDAETRIRALEDRIATLEKSEAKLTAAAATAPAVTASRDGLVVRSADNAFSFRLRGYVQSDARFFGANGEVAQAQHSDRTHTKIVDNLGRDSYVPRGLWARTPMQRGNGGRGSQWRLG